LPKAGPVVLIAILRLFNKYIRTVNTSFEKLVINIVSLIFGILSQLKLSLQSAAQSECPALPRRHRLLQSATQSQDYSWFRDCLTTRIPAARGGGDIFYPTSNEQHRLFSRLLKTHLFARY